MGGTNFVMNSTGGVELEHRAKDETDKKKRNALHR